MTVNVGDSARAAPSLRRVGPPAGGLSRRGLLALAPALLLAGAGTARAAERRRLRFEVFRGKDAIGSHTIGFARDGERLQVEVATDVALELVGVPVYRYSHRGHEVWQGGYLQSLDTETDDDGTRYSVAGRRTERGFSIDGSAGSYVVSAGVIPGSYWNSDLVQTNALIDVETGELFDISVVDRGQDIVEAADEQVRAHRFKVTGRRIAHLWYDASGLIVKMAFETAGEYIENRLRAVEGA